MNYDLIITHHARERWVERIMEPVRFAHLAACRRPGCETCDSLRTERSSVIRGAKRSVDGSLAASFRAATEPVCNRLFMQAVAKRYGRQADRLGFRKNGNAVFVVAKEAPPVLLTVMSQDMVQGLIFMTLDHRELRPMFEELKHQRRIRERSMP